MHMHADAEPAVIPCDRESLAARALEFHALGYNCAQCVACVLAPHIEGADADACFRAAEGFGGGMGCASETCGAVSGGVVAFGFANSAGAGDPSRKASTYRMSRALVERFRDEVGSTVCRTIKGADTGVRLRSCDDCIAIAVRIAYDVLEEAR